MDGRATWKAVGGMSHMDAWGLTLEQAVTTGVGGFGK